MSGTAKLVIAFMFVLVLSLMGTIGGFGYLMNSRVTGLEEQIGSSSGTQVVQVIGEGGDTATTTVIDRCGDACKKEVAKQVAKAIDDLPATTQTVTQTVAAPIAKKTSSFITLNGTVTSTSTDWETIESSAVWIDINNDYGGGAIVTWSASLKVAHGNGQAFARLWDDTNKIAVAGSEISTTNNVDYEQKVSGNLPLWAGNNLYKVQLKSLNGFEVTFSGGKMKVGY